MTPQLRAPRVYRALLRLCWPAAESRAHGRDLEEMFAHLLRGARTRGPGAVARTWARGVADLVFAAIIAHAHRFSERTTLSREATMTKNSIGEAAAEYGRDIRFAVRALARERMFAATALLTLVVCLAGNTAIFSIVRSVLLKPLPIAESGSIVLVSNIYPKAGAPNTGPNAFAASVPDFYDRKAAVPAFGEIGMYRRANAAIELATGAERVTVVRATPSFYSLLRARSLRGRGFAEDDAVPGADNNAIISFGFWKRAYGGDSAIIGKDVRVNGVAFRIVGVMRPDFQYVWNDVDLWLPLGFTPAQRSDNARHSNNWNMIARLAPKATVAQAQREVDALNARLADQFPQFRTIIQDSGFRTVVTPLQEEIVRAVRPTLYLLWGGAVLVLLVGGVNLANLFMVRAAARSREMAIRHALGGRLGRLSRQLLTETTLLTLAGTAVGVAVAAWVLRSVTALHLDTLPRGHEIAIDWVSVMTMLAIAVALGVITGLTPIGQLLRVNVVDALRDGGRGGSTGAAPNRLRSALATGQIALAFVLLVGAGLLMSSFRAVLRISPGFAGERVMTASVNLPVARYGDQHVLAMGTSRVLDAVRAIPGVTAAGTTTTIPFAESFNSSIILAEGYQAKPGESLVSPLQITVSGGYFEAMGIQLARGRSFDARDIESSVPVVVVDERLAAHFWPGQDPVGHRMYLPQNPQDALAPSPNTQYMSVIGVVRNVSLTGLAPSEPLVGAFYLAQSQLPARALTLVVRTSGMAASVTDAMRAAVSSVDPQLPLYAMQTMDERLDRSLVPRRLPMLLATTFGGVALFLAAIGVYGVLAYRVSQRRREIGIRLALGGSTGDVFMLVLRDGVRITGIGLALGAVGLIGVTKAIAGLLYGVRPLDVTVIAAVAVLLAVVALVATAVPARRAARVDPAGVLNE